MKAWGKVFSRESLEEREENGKPTFLLTTSILHDAR